MTTEPYRLRNLQNTDDYKHVSGVLSDAFGDDFFAEAEERDRSVFEPARNHVIEYEGAVVANAGAFTREMTVPGAVVAAAHVTEVGVRPSHRRRGLLTRLMLHQLSEIRDTCREPFAVLWASEGRIYQRFGYGQAALRQSMVIDTREVRLTRSVTPEVGRVRDLAPEDARKELEQVYERVRPDRPGWSGRDENWWTRRLMDPPERREGHTAVRALLFDSAAGTQGSGLEEACSGYALWRRKMSWDDAGPKGEVSAGEIVAATPEAYAAIWQFLLSVDLVRTVRYWFGAVDEPLRYLVNEPRRLNTSVGDSLWVRVVDVPAALSARRYASPVDVVFEVTDGLLPDNAGRWRLAADTTGATCASTSDAPDLTCDITDLGAAYLGGASLSSLAAAGRVRELRPGALAAASAAFGWHRAPSALEIF